MAETNQAIEAAGTRRTKRLISIDNNQNSLIHRSFDHTDYRAVKQYLAT